MDTDVDKLEYLFMLQRKFQSKMNDGFYAWCISKDIDKDKEQYIKDMSMALVDEVMEAVRETPWKPWKKQQDYKREEFQKELVDAWHFLINLTLVSGMSSDDLFDAFLEKHQVNNDRQKNKY